MWHKTDYEKHLDKMLVEELGEDKAESVFAQYTVARDKVLNEIKEIKGVDPSLSDHGPDHIRDVLDNAFALMSGDNKVHELTSLDLYVLALVIAFHDVGNLFGRKNHREKLSEVFDWARGTDAEARREKRLVIRAAEAHTGIAPTGSKDTLNEVASTEHMNSVTIKLRTIAAILRFADELAEGPQRTTDFFRTQVGYDGHSQIYHRYASCTHIAIDRLTERIRVAYEIKLDEFNSEDGSLDTDALDTFLTFLFGRVAKLDDERRYARFYCTILSVFKQTNVAIYFSYGHEILSYAVEFQLDDLVVPGDSEGTFSERYPDKCEEVGGIVRSIVDNLRRGGETHEL